MSKAQALHKLMFVICVLFFLLVTLQAPAQSDTPTTSTPIYHHQLRVELSPSLKMLKAEDTITFPPGTFSSDAPVKLSFLLNKHLQITTVNPHDSITVLHPATQDESYTEYGLSLNE
ncbi:MAG TPA: hypothetical protein VN132_09650, partial [Bdellovibrio sp.]|nr:hypothetical protein [Bdellovibrio sp.]